MANVMGLLPDIQVSDTFRNMNTNASSKRGNAVAVSLLRELVHIETPSLNVAASARIAEVLTSHFTEIGAEVTLRPTSAGTNLIITAPGVGEPLLLVGHTDTVWPVGTLAGAMPWRETDGKLAGPGVYDMKSGIVIMHAALSRLAGTPHRAVRIVLVCDEEVGSPTSQAVLREASAGTVAALGFESPHPDGAFKIGRLGSTRIKLTAGGRAAHAALDPELGVSAIDELIDQLLHIRAITASPELPSPVLSNIGVIRGGALTNVVPASASAEIGLRFGDPATEEHVLRAIAALTPVRSGATFDCEQLSHRPAWLASAADRALLETVRAAALRVDQRVEGRPASGAGDTNLLGSLGHPTLDGFGPRGGGAHAENEHVLIDSLHERIELLVAVLMP